MAKLTSSRMINSGCAIPSVLREQERLSESSERMINDRERERVREREQQAG